MPRPRKSPDNTGLMSWAAIGKELGISAAQARREGQRAMQKLRKALEAEGIDVDYLHARSQMLERQEPTAPETLALLLLQDDK